jgi:hypothetical protein
MLLTKFELQNIGIGIASVFVALAVWLACDRLRDEVTKVKAPRIGNRKWFLGLRHASGDFAKNGKLLTKEGYERFKESMYWIQTGETDRLVLSNRYLDEIRRLPDTYLDSRLAVVERNCKPLLCGPYNLLGCHCLFCY